MSNDIMTPDEIEKLLQSVGELQSSQPYSLDINDYLSPDECDMLGEIGNICMGTSATALYDLLEHKVMITTPSVSVQTQELMMQEYPAPIVSVGVHYTDGIEGDSVLLLKEYDAALITDLLIGGDGNIDPYDVNLEELQLSAIREVMNQLVGASATSLADLLGRSVNISTPVSKRILIGDDSLKEIIAGDVFVKISFKMEIENLLSSEIMQIWSLDFAKKLCEMMMLVMTGEAPAQSPTETVSSTPDDFLMSNAAQSRNVTDLESQYNTASQNENKTAQQPPIPQQPPMTPPIPQQQPPVAPQMQQQPPMTTQMPSQQPQMPPQAQQPQMQQQMPPQAQQPQMQQQMPPQAQQPYGYPPQYPGMDPNQPQQPPQAQQPYGYPPQYPGMDPNQPQQPPQQPYGYPPQYPGMDPNQPPQQPYGYPPYGYPPYGYPPQYPYSPQQQQAQQDAAAAAATAAAAGFAAAQQAHHTRQIITSNGADADKVKDVLYPEFDSVHIPKLEVPSDNLNLIMKVPVEVSVVLGKKRLKIKEVLDFNAGTVVVLDKIAGEAVDILVNGTAVAKGEVVVVDDNYGVRITEINTAQLIDSL